MKLLVLIPAYNEAANIGAVIHEVREYLPSAIIVVVDDGSRDCTAQVARENQANVLQLPHNLGIGGAVQTGLRLATIKEVDYIVRLDGDGQHPAKEIVLLLEPVVNDKVDIAIGSRFCGDAIPPAVSMPRKIGIWLFCRLTSFLSGYKVTDPTSGFMAMNHKVAAFLACNLAQDYPEVDARVLLKREGFRIAEIPIVMRSRQGGVSSINAMRALYYAFKVTLSVLAARSRITTKPASTINQESLEAIEVVS